MVQDRKEPTLSGIKPERDEIMTHQSRMNKGAQKGASRSSGRPAPGRSVVGTFALALAFVSLGAAGFAGWQLQKANAGLTSAEDRIAELEARLNLTSTESDQSVSAIHDKLEWADSEIRKLWGVAYDTNRNSIKTNKENITQLSDKLSTAASDAQQAKQTVNTVQSLNNEQQLVLTQLSEDMTRVKNDLEQMSSQVSELQSQMEDLEGLPARVGTNEDAIEAIDAFRRSINADVQQLKQRSGTTGP